MTMSHYVIGLPFLPDVITAATAFIQAFLEDQILKAAILGQFKLEGLTKISSSCQK